MKSFAVNRFVNEINRFLKDNQGNYLEIGVYRGDTIVKIAGSNPDRECIGLDPFIADGYTGEERFTKLEDVENTLQERIKEFNNIEIIKTTSMDYFESKNVYIQGFRYTYFKLDRNISCVYIDGSHHYDDVVNDIELALALIDEKKGLIVIDDLHIDDVRRAIEWAIENYPQHFKEIGNFYYINK